VQEVDFEQLPEPDAQLALALKTLTPDQQIVLALRYARDLSVPQIAERIGLREGTVKSRLHFALRHLRAAIEAERRREETPNV
jgi:RNA polymerase sigma-70 factor (ECF subfamily)